ncbi:helix-turn-helix domain-containing protein [Iningainema tapete]|uniref:Helix-turn-helix transcriptional regulator n=1 Tax=Iningainema tapete BLCC-T55 TaxID=2748662 RepID=A0A8J6XN89_9CYAN|nr:helix-turn-helix domain-containing protein [Iningainema tapete]MBD2770938.1 helix-turn-helix transcriptional regulator [Iningainema tapete BLCC-T55]
MSFCKLGVDDVGKNDQTKLMISLECVDRLHWSHDLGKRLQSLRGKVSMRELAQKVSRNGLTCTYQYIHKLEVGKAEAVSTELILAICNALDVDFKKLFPSVYIDPSELLVVLQKNVA